MQSGHMCHEYFKYLVDLMARRRGVLVSFVLLGLVVGGWLVWVYEDRYRSSTIISVEQPKSYEQYFSGVGKKTESASIPIVKRQVLSRSNLQQVIDEFHLSDDIVRQYGYEPVIDSLRKNVTIEAKGLGGQSKAFSISFADPEPEIAMKVTSRLASQFIYQRSQKREQMLEKITEVIDQELAVAKKALEENEGLLTEYKRKFSRELPSQLEANLRARDHLHVEKRQTEEFLKDLRSRLTQVQNTMMISGGNPSIYTGASRKRAPSSLRQQLSEAQNTLTQMLNASIEDTPGIIFLKRYIEKLELEQEQDAESSRGSEEDKSTDPLLELENKQNELNGQVVTMETQLQQTSASLANIEGRIRRTPEREQALRVLERQYDLSKENYQHLHQRRINVRISENLSKRQKQGGFSIFEPANLPVKPEGIPRTILAVGGVASGVGMGFGMAILLDFLFPTIRRSGDVEVLLGFPLLAIIPRFQMVYDETMSLLSGNEETTRKIQGKAKEVSVRDYVDLHGMRKGKSWFQRGSFNNLSSHPQLNLVSRWRPQSIVAEQFRVAATRVDLLGDRPMGNVVLVSSAMKGEGKTSTSANLAYTLARDLDEPILIIDCDYKCPNLHHVLELRSFPGIADYLAGQTSLESCFQQYPDLPLWCLLVGDVEANPVTLSKLRYLSSLIDSVRSRYRFIILDGPPILPLADINVLSGLADIVLMVVRSGSTPKEVVQKATEMLPTSHTTRVILTDAWSEGIPQYVGHRYSTTSPVLSLR